MTANTTDRIDIISIDADPTATTADRLTLSWDPADHRIYSDADAAPIETIPPQADPAAALAALLEIYGDSYTWQPETLLTWYAVQLDASDDWGRGSYSLAEAEEMRRQDSETYGAPCIIAVIRGGCCIDEL